MTQPLMILMLLLLGVLLFGKRLPDIAKQLGQGLLEFKNGMGDLAAGHRSVGRPAVAPESLGDASRYAEIEERESVSGRFELPPDV